MCRSTFWYPSPAFCRLTVPDVNLSNCSWNPLHGLLFPSEWNWILSTSWVDFTTVGWTPLQYVPSAVDQWWGPSRTFKKSPPQLCDSPALLPTSKCWKSNAILCHEELDMIHVQSVPAGYGFGYCGDVISFPPLAWPINLEQSSEKELSSHFMNLLSGTKTSTNSYGICGDGAQGLSGGEEFCLVQVVVNGVSNEYLS